MTDLICYDSESTDLDVRHAQITQFASVRLNERFDVVEEKELLVKRLPYIVPSPEALRVTGVGAFELDRPERISEYEASRILERILTPRPGQNQVNLTFNGAGFDDELIRTTLFRNLRNPWFYSDRRIRRVDLLPVVQLVAAAEPDVIVIPQNESGKKSWKLEAICQANGIEIDAHDAMGDVRATIALGRLIMDRAPWAWNEALICGTPHKLEARLNEAMRSASPVWLFIHYGAPEIVPCAVLATDGKKKWILLDLRHDDFPTETSAIAERLYTKDSPFRVIRSNAVPMLLSESEIARFRFDGDPAILCDKALSIKGTQGLDIAARDALLAMAFNGENVTSEEKIYANFVSEADRARMNAFHRAKTWQERAEIQFADPRLNDFSARIIAEAILAGRADDLDETTSEDIFSRFSQIMARPHAGADAHWMTLTKARSLPDANAEFEHWATTVFGDRPAEAASIVVKDEPTDDVRTEDATTSTAKPDDSAQLSFGF